MADEQSPRPTPARQSNNRPAPPRQANNRPRPNGSQQPSPHWRVTPPPGGKQPPNSSMRGRPRGPRSQWAMLIAVVAVLLAINLWISSAALSPNRVKIPYSPTFTSQLSSGNVSSISSTSYAVEGTFKKAVRYPKDDKTAQA